jgi:hypothetical protein
MPDLIASPTLRLCARSLFSDRRRIGIRLTTLTRTIDRRVPARLLTQSSRALGADMTGPINVHAYRLLTNPPRQLGGVRHTGLSFWRTGIVQPHSIDLTRQNGGSIAYTEPVAAGNELRGEIIEQRKSPLIGCGRHGSQIDIQYSYAGCAAGSWTPERAGSSRWT